MFQRNIGEVEVDVLQKQVGGYKCVETCFLAEHCGIVANALNDRSFRQSLVR